MAQVEKNEGITRNKQSRELIENMLYTRFISKILLNTAGVLFSTHQVFIPGFAMKGLQCL